MRGEGDVGRVRERIRELAVRAGLAGVPEPVVIAGLMLCAVVCAFAGFRAWQAQTTAAASGSATGAAVTRVPSAARPPSASVEATVVVVDVSGAVRRPGVVHLPGGSRVTDAISAAGGLKPDARASGINLARKLVDGEQILVPGPGDGPATPTGPGAGAAGVGQPSASTPPPAPGGAPAGKVDLNTADAGALDALPGVGPSTAKNILDDRAANGPFNKVEDLMRVTGIGPKKFEALKDLVTAGR